MYIWSVLPATRVSSFLSSVLYIISAFLSSKNLLKRVRTVFCNCAWAFPFYQKAGPASLVCSLCHCPGSGTQKDPVLGFMFFYHSLEILYVLFNKGSCIFILLWDPAPQLCSWLCLENKVLAETRSESLFPSEHGTTVFRRSPSLERVGGQPDSFLRVGHMILLPECLKKSFLFELQPLTRMGLCVKLSTLPCLGTRYAPASICTFVSENDPYVIYLGLFCFFRK